MVVDGDGMSTTSCSMRKMGFEAGLDPGSKLDQRTKGINGEGQKEQARQLFFKGDCKVSTMEFLSTCKNVYNNLSCQGGYKLG